MDGYFESKFDDFVFCEDKDECHNENACDLKTEFCINTAGSYECHCNFGWVQTEVGAECLDWDECEHNHDKCGGVSVRVFF